MQFAQQEYPLKIQKRLIPRSSATNCAGDQSYRAKLGVCSCEPHCSWDLCRLTDTPIDCLNGTSSKWKRDDQQHTWVAQIDQGIDGGLLAQIKYTILQFIIR